MSDYTRLNLKDHIEDVAERFGIAPNMEARYGCAVERKVGAARPKLASADRQVWNAACWDAVR